MSDPYSIQGGNAPCTNVEIGGSTCRDALLNVQECNPEYNLDCRAFYDENAIPHNRLLSKTIPITEKCINLRREFSNQVYKVFPSMSKTCSASNVGCTTYKGNNSDNVRNIFMEDFESGSTLGWKAETVDSNAIIHNANLRHASEAIHYNGSSMRVWTDNSSDQEIWIFYNLTAAGERIIPGKQYSLSFWAKAFGDNTSPSSIATGYHAPPPPSNDAL